MSKAWCEKYKVTKPLDFKNKEESHASLNANGTGPFILTSRQPGIKTTWKRNPNWWSKMEGNVQEVVLTPISSDPTRTAALVSGELDFVLDPAPRDIPRAAQPPPVSRSSTARRTGWYSSAWTRRATSCCTAACRATRTRSRMCGCDVRCTRPSTSRPCARS